MVEDPKPTNPMTLEEFTRRFKKTMTDVTEKFDDGESVAEYADQVAPTYYEDYYLKYDESPEDCAENDMSYWGEE